jgi:DNA repair protein RadC
MSDDTKTDRVLYRIADLAPSDRPRERLEKFGPGVLSDPELLAILLRVGIQGMNAVQMGNSLLHKFGGIYGLHQAPFEDICAEKGLGPAKAAQIKAAIELGRRLSAEKPKEKSPVNSPADAAALIQFAMNALEQEELWVILLDVRNRVLDIVDVYKGSVNSSHVRVGEMFKAAIRRNAVSIIIAHNHPSGDPSPSPDDVAVTRAFINAGKLLDIEVLDHLVIGGNRFISMKERGLGFSGG